jgi:alpha-tubulin suppressor-like RCC1 family protein
MKRIPQFTLLLMLVTSLLFACSGGDPCGDLVLDPGTESCICPEGFLPRPELGICEGPDGSVVRFDGGSPTDAALDTLEGRDAGPDCTSRRYFRDRDGDGFGSADSIDVCVATEGYVLRSGDCDDECPSCHPGAAEVCDGRDNDCDEVVDGAAATLDCAVPPGSVETICASGACRVLTCLEPRRDCDEAYDNGCETALGSESDCLSCGDSCAWSCEATGCVDAESVEAGTYFSCTRRDDGTLACWGYGELGQLGDGAFASRNRPIVLSGSYGDFALGLWHACAVGDGGTVLCWGVNASGEVGDGTMERAGTPTTVNMLGGFARSLGCGGGHSCAVLTNGSLNCWGNNSWGQLGITAGAARVAPVRAIGAGVFEVAAGFGFTCALMTNNTVRCWGENLHGQLGNDTRTNSSSPSQVLGLSRVRAIDADPQGNFVCALLDDGTVWCWGRNDVGQLGDGTMTTRQIPVRVQGLPEAQAISVGETHACAVRASGVVVCWGAGDRGQLGNGAMSASGAPVEVIGLCGVSSLGCGGHHCCAVSSGAVSCWGRNASGELGDATTEARGTPVRVSPPG